ncbi:phage tail protein [Desulfobacter hydrogenophilus]|uniref:Phage tail protein n=1 Tax=Desulfobacter hydrogenophilus TaxID=2291 RepID=A0A328FER0_9BACT|nr:phage tail protein [Desulfobacter hydrogenophilus]NDY71147.1 phage tail protein [Desulfobacter hydrogenophilus]QBH14251.1 phage tail protein [Desulfobacter hydrogenophilus]RAM02819.1 phage tail protein [Desulfobacter hydrogenophilus]
MSGQGENRGTILDYPLPVFRFEVRFTVSADHPGASGERLLCGGAFSECSGLEATMEPKAIKAGGRNYGEIQRAGRVSFSTVILKRGVTRNRDLWKWFELVAKGAYAYRLKAEVTLFDFDVNGEKKPVMAWEMLNALPTKFKTADFNSTFTQAAIEELHFVHEGLIHKDNLEQETGE